MSAVFGSTPVYSYSLAFAPNGNVLTANDSVNGNWNYSYDQFNRLVCASLSSNTACAMPPTGTPTYTYAYDRFGNRWQQNSPSGAIYTSSFSFTGNGGNNTNRMDSYSYDSAGNLLFDNAHHYFYDAENRLIQVDGTLPYCTSNGSSGSAATACYYYDANGHRVHRTGYTIDTCDNTGKRDYIFDLEGRVIVENNSAGTACLIQVYAGERHFGRQGGGSFFYHSDWLGTVRYVNADLYPTDPNETCTSLPFGDGLTCSSTRWDVWHFTGKERDYESGLDNFGARYDSSSMGRFMSPDPLYIEMHRLVDPQQLNLYMYGRNSPLLVTDPTGLDITCGGTRCADYLAALQKDVSFKIKYDDKGKVVTDGDPGKVKGASKELLNAIDDTKHHVTINAIDGGKDAGVFFGRSDGDHTGAHTIAFGQAALLDSDKNAGGMTSAQLIGHETLEGYDESKGASYSDAHNYANWFFGGLDAGKILGLYGNPQTGMAYGVTQQFQVHGTHTTENIKFNFVTPIPSTSIINAGNTSRYPVSVERPK